MIAGALLLAGWPGPGFPQEAVSKETVAAPPSWMTVDSAARTVRLALEATAGDSGTALINGLRGRAIQIVVPLKWTVQWTWRNADSSTAHSLVVMVEREKLPAEGGRPAFTNAMTRMVTAGLKVGQVDQTSFEAEEAGWYWMLCGVPGHALRGEWIGLRVDPGARSPAVNAKD